MSDKFDAWRGDYRRPGMVYKKDILRLIAELRDTVYEVCETTMQVRMLDSAFALAIDKVSRMR